MGGEGSGRKPGTEKVVGNMLGYNQPAPTIPGESFYIPNYSGIQTAALKSSAALTATPTNLTASGGTTVYGTFPNFTVGSPILVSGAINAVFVAASGALIASGAILDIVVPFNCTLTGYTLLPNTTGSVIVEAWKDTYANFPPTAADTMFSGGMVLSSAAKAQDNTLSTWNKTINTNDIIRLNVSGASTTLSQVTVVLNYTR